MRGWERLHIAGMGSSYVLMLIAFYVDNGKQLPPLNQLSPWTYWALPMLIGVPIILWQLLRHRSSGIVEPEEAWSRLSASWFVASCS
jgi:hypothetical protein